ncbi:peroxiredoxin-like family protein [Mycobacterium paraseoulense]|uniref:thioredoxin-dependent peroxiredoxin n=1 Tax=Mycobacterium paraseoulense TaxID=590652 RepID=A0A1X0I484_9MYCO|nr:peroxiredoxin-like family protein [Mycobacterium paraseoulense]MCV7396904.1 AhpC/TSA family protein [Mycobacterium paraseoulense]ORB33303.1 peroxiredoxin [Mycobacterium paraseoulense]
MTSTADTNHVTIAERVAGFQQEMASQLPQDVADTFGAEQARLRAGGVPAGVAAPGTAMPGGQLLDVHGEPTTLAESVGGRTAVVVLYRGAWCPYCNLALRAYQEHLVPSLAHRDVALVAISPQKPDGSLSSQEINALSFTVLSDPGNQLAAGLGVLTAPSDDAQAAQRSLGLELREANADGTYGLPMPTVTIVDRAGTIRWIDVHPDYTTRTEVADIVAALDSLE